MKIRVNSARRDRRDDGDYLIVEWDASEDGTFNPNHGGFFLRTSEVKFVDDTPPRPPPLKQVRSAIREQVRDLIAKRESEQAAISVRDLTASYLGTFDLDEPAPKGRAQ